MSPTNSERHPLKFLLYLEWILIGITVLAELPSGMPRFERLHARELNLVGMGLFAAMGWYMPRRISQKGGYIGLQMVLLTVLSFGGMLRLFPLPFIVLVIRNCVTFVRSRDLYYRSCVTAFSFGICVFVQWYRLQLFPRSFPRARLEMIPERFWGFWLSTLLTYGLVMLFLQLLVGAVMAERQGREKLAIAHRRLREYAVRVEDVATLQERNRIAREIHDSLGHSLTVFNLHVEAALRLFKADPTEAQALLVEAKQLASSALQEVRQSVASLRSDPWQNKSLEDLISGLAEDFARSTGITPTQILQITHPIPSDVKIAVYRIVQESLTNICKYAEATVVTIQVITQDAIQATIEDNGKGFIVEQNQTGFGLQGMRERSLMLGGQFTIHTAPRQGCKIVVQFPLTDD